MKKPRYHQNVTITIKNLGFHGEGVGHWQGYTLFADGALPGEVVRGRVVERLQRFGRIRVEEILQPSPLRVESPCPAFPRCGGCQLMVLPYEEQLRFKRQRVVDALERFGGLTQLNVADCVPSPSCLGYRNKALGQLVETENGISFAMQARFGEASVPAAHCKLHRPELNVAVAEACDFLSRKGNPGIEALWVRASAARHQSSMGLVVRRGVEGDAALVELAEWLVAKGVRGVVRGGNISDEGFALDNSWNLLAGNPYLEEQLEGFLLRLSPLSFFQVNVEQAVQVYRKAMEVADLSPSDVVLDAYCGVGVLGLLASRRCRRVVGVESSAEAIEDAKYNAALNGVEGIRFVCADVDSSVAEVEDCSLAFVNPPRSGCTPLFLEALAAKAPRTIVMISCDPATLGRDAALLCSKGYEMKEVVPFDLFPQTSHIETVTRFERPSSD